MARKTDPATWRHRCPHMVLGRSRQPGWRKVPLDEACNLCYMVDPAAKKRTATANRRQKLKDAGYVNRTHKVPLIYADDLKDHAAMLCQRYEETKELCGGEHQHIPIFNNKGKRQCARCEEILV